MYVLHNASQQLYEARDHAMTNMAQLVTWMDATADPQERDQLNKQLFRLHTMLLSAGLVLASREPTVFRKLSVRWHHHQPHLDCLCPDVLEQMKPVLVRFGATRCACMSVCTPLQTMHVS